MGINLMILTCACWPSEEIARQKLWIFLKSCEKFGIVPHLYGTDSPQFPSYRRMKLDMQLEYLKAHTEFSHTLYTDSWDAFFCASVEEIVAKYEAMGSPSILASAARQLANVSDEEKHYPNCFDHSIVYRYPHVGGYLAETGAIIEAFERMLALPRQTGDDCFNHFDAWQEGWYRPQIDSGCQIFQEGSDDIELVEGRVWNRVTNSNPCILHLSGGYTSSSYGKDDRLIPWVKRTGILDGSVHFSGDAIIHGDNWGDVK